jgi:hypothetical protein
MVLFIPTWIAVTILAFRVLRRILSLLVEVALLLLWAAAMILRGVVLFGVAQRRGEQDPRWARRALRAIRRLPEVEGTVRDRRPV